ncbi:uncharacterized protein LOC127582123 [Pristis pectinata]|uniref:uncharacterized protein LOC127582123 n=1 Tax=Pristis pectinata TaxID=685728 RepID=UPI00223E8168|nr:uncharacterized protein LOC127582123 [Pristis pectinata]
MEYSNKLDEVDLAWDNLQEAKSVLQQIENKLNSEEDDCLPEPSIRKCLQSEALGCSVQNTSSLSNKGSSPHQPTSMTNNRLDSHRTLPHNWTPSSSRSNNNRKFNYKLDNCGSSRRMFCHERINPSYNDIIDQDAHLSGVSQTTITIEQKSSDNPSTRVIPTRLQVLADWDTSEKGCHMAREQDVCSQSNKYSVEGGPPVDNGANLAFDCYSQRQMLQEKKSSTEPFIYSLSSPGSPFIQCLELKRNKSPTNKLDRLKERIRVQRKLQKEEQFVRNNSNLPQEQSIPFLRQKIHKDGSEKCLVRKVTCAPPAPAYKGK